MTTWTPETQQEEVWTATVPVVHVFDPAVFAPNPVFDTYTAGLWANSAQSAEAWTPA